MGGEKIHSLYLQPKDTSNHGPSAYRTVPYAYVYKYTSSKYAYAYKYASSNHGLHINPNNETKPSQLGEKPDVHSTRARVNLE